MQKLVRFILELTGQIRYNIEYKLAKLIQMDGRTGGWSSQHLQVARVLNYEVRRAEKFIILAGFNRVFTFGRKAGFWSYFASRWGAEPDDLDGQAL